MSCKLETERKWWAKRPEKQMGAGESMDKQEDPHPHLVLHQMTALAGCDQAEVSNSILRTRLEPLPVLTPREPASWATLPCPYSGT